METEQRAKKRNHNTSRIVSTKELLDTEEIKNCTFKYWFIKLQTIYI